MNLSRLNIWRKCIIVGFLVAVTVMFTIDWGYHFHIGHVVRLLVGAAAFWLAVDQL